MTESTFLFLYRRIWVSENQYSRIALRKMYPNTEFIPAFSPNAEKSGPEKTPYLDTLAYAVLMKHPLTTT